MSTETKRSSSAGTRATSTASGFTSCIRYGFPEDYEGPRQQGTLTSIHEPVPEGANTVSPVYLVRSDRYEHQFELSDPWAISGSAPCIATEIQDECEQNEKVWYPIYVESDAEVPLDQMASSLAKFVREIIGIAPEECSFYYSGGRSIHIHVPRFVETEDDLKHLKKRAKEWNEERDVTLDAGIYSRKRQFRLPGVEHAKTGLRKTPIEPEWSHDQIFRAGNEVKSEVKPETYDDVLEIVFGAGLATLIGKEAVGDGDDVMMSFTSQKDVEAPVEEWATYPEYHPENRRWLSYNAKEFSPYANATVGDRSVSAVEVVGTPYQRRDVGKSKILVPTRFYGAVGCDGDFTKRIGDHAPLQLSKRDYEKYLDNEYQVGDCLVTIGGQSRSSRIFRVSQEVASTIGEILGSKEKDANCYQRRDSALECLCKRGFDVGSSRNNSSNTMDYRREAGRRDHWEPSDRIYSVRNPSTKAGKLQQQAEQTNIGNLTHDERYKLACRLLGIGTWDAVWNWFEQQYGTAFKPDVTYEELSNIVSQYPKDYSHVDVELPS